MKTNNPAVFAPYIMNVTLRVEFESKERIATITRDCSQCAGVEYDLSTLTIRKNIPIFILVSMIDTAFMLQITNNFSPL